MMVIKVYNYKWDSKSHLIKSWSCCWRWLLLLLLLLWFHLSLGTATKFHLSCEVSSQLLTAGNHYDRRVSQSGPGCCPSPAYWGPKWKQKISPLATSTRTYSKLAPRQTDLTFASPPPPPSLLIPSQQFKKPLSAWRQRHLGLMHHNGLLQLGWSLWRWRRECRPIRGEEGREMDQWERGTKDHGFRTSPRWHNVYVSKRDDVL